MKREIKTTIALDGTAAFNKNLSSAQRQLKVYDSELQKVKTDMNNGEDAMDGYGKAAELLNRKIDQQEEIVRALGDAVKESAEQYGDADARTDNYRIKLNKAETALSDMKKELKNAEQALEDAEKATQGAAEETDGYSESLDGLSDSAGDAAGAGDKVKLGFGDFSSAIGGPIGGVIGQMDNLTAAADITSGGVKGSALVMAGAIGGIAGEAINAVKEIGKISDEMQNAEKEIRSTSSKARYSLGLTAEETERLKDAGKDLYRSGYAESFEAGMDALAATKGYFKDLDDTSLKNLAAEGLHIQNVFGQDLPSVMKTASTMASSFGIDASEALKIVYATLQTNPAEAGELLDSLNEYSNQFDKLGYSAGEFATILASGMEAGAFSVDKVGDSYKELAIRSMDGSEQTKQALTDLGLAAGGYGEELDGLTEKQGSLNDKIDDLNKKREALKKQGKSTESVDKSIEKAHQELGRVTTRIDEINAKAPGAKLSVDDMMRQIAQGGEPAKQAIEQIMTALAGVDDPLEQNRIGVALMGSQWEDVGPKILTQLGHVEDRFGDLNKSALDDMKTLTGDTMTSAAKYGADVSMEYGETAGNIVEKVMDSAGGRTIRSFVAWISGNKAEMSALTYDFAQLVVSDPILKHTKLAESMTQYLAESGIPNSLNDGKEIIKETTEGVMQEGVIDPVTGKTEDASTAAQGVMKNGIAAGVLGAKVDVTTATDDVMRNGVISKISGGAVPARSAGQRVMIDGLQVGISGQGGSISATTAALMQQGILSPVDNAKGPAKTAGETVVRDGIKAGVEQEGGHLSASGDWLSGNLITGFTSGLSGRKGGLLGTVSSIFGGVITKVQNLFGIASPSKVFAGIADHDIDGFVIQMRRRETDLQRTTEKVFAGVTTSAQDAIQPPEMGMRYRLDIAMRTAERAMYSADGARGVHPSQQHGERATRNVTVPVTIGQFVNNDTAQDVNRLTDMISRQIDDKVRRKGAVWA